MHWIFFFGGSFPSLCLGHHYPFFPCRLLYMSVICSSICSIDCRSILSAYLFLYFIWLIFSWCFLCIIENIIVASFSSFSFLMVTFFIFLAGSDLSQLPPVKRENSVRSWYISTKYVLTLSHVFLPVAFFPHLIRFSSVKLLNSKNWVMKMLSSSSPLVAISLAWRLLVRSYK